VGAYQESLANEHNLFGAIHEVEVHVNPEGEWEITKITQGDPIDELLVSRNYSMDEITDAYSHQLDEAVRLKRMDKDDRDKIYEKLIKCAKSYPYLLEDGTL
jgi:arginine decarboxylase